jgi:hypothetical protein
VRPRVTDEDGVDAPFDRAMRAAVRDDERAAKTAPLTLREGFLVAMLIAGAGVVERSNSAWLLSAQGQPPLLDRTVEVESLLQRGVLVLFDQDRRARQADPARGDHEVTCEACKQAAEAAS